jgi:TonB family protein
MSFFAAALGAHAVLLGGVGLAQYWKVDAVQAADLIEPYQLTPVTFVPPLVAEKPPTPKKSVAPPQKQDVIPPMAEPPSTTPIDTQPLAVPNSTPTPPSNPDPGPATTPGPPSTGSTSGNGVPNAIGGGDDDGPIQIGFGITPPVALSRVSPLYTESARRAHIQGVVIVEAVIDREGNVGEVRVLKGLGFGLDENATNAVERWKFKPAHANDGRPVAVYFRLTVDYHLN